MALECCIKTDGFAAMDADELFFINGGSGSYGCCSGHSTASVSQTTNNGNNNTYISYDNHGTQTVVFGNYNSGHASGSSYSSNVGGSGSGSGGGK